MTFPLRMWTPSARSWRQRNNDEAVTSSRRIQLYKTEEEEEDTSRAAGLPHARTHARTDGRTHAKLPACGAVWLVPIPWRAIGHRGLVMVASRGAGGLQRGEYCVIFFFLESGRRTVAP